MVREIDDVDALQWLTLRHAMHNRGRKRKRDKEHQYYDVYRSAYKSHTLRTRDEFTLLNQKVNAVRIDVHRVVVDF